MHIRILSPAGSIKQKVVEAGERTLESWGHRVSIAPHALDTYGRFAGTPEQRAQDIVDALCDPDVDILWATRGGYGCMQILDLIPVELVREARKPVFGYSDITALHALWAKAGVQSVHSPMMKHLGEDPTHRSTRTLKELVDYYAVHRAFPERHNRFFLDRTVLERQGWIAPDDQDSSSQPDFSVFDLPTPPPFVGGNLSVMSALHGTPYDYDYAGKVLFIEDISESPYKIDRMMQQLRLMGVLGQIKALVCGHFTHCDEDPMMPVKIWDNIRWIAHPYGIPVLMGMPIGHEVENYPVVVG